MDSGLDYRLDSGLDSGVTLIWPPLYGLDIGTYAIFMSAKTYCITNEPGAGVANIEIIHGGCVLVHPFHPRPTTLGNTQSVYPAMREIRKAQIG